MVNNEKNQLSTKKLSHLFKAAKGFGKGNRTMLLFGFEGVLIALINNLVNNNNNLFATRLGASDFQLSLVIALPQLIGMLVLIPGGIFTDRMTNKRKMVIFSLSLLTSIYIALGFVPMLGRYSLTAFLILLAISVGPMTIYNTSWQAYFSDVVPIKKRNKTFTLRTKWTFLINVAAPLLTGTLLASAADNSEKLKIHQSFFWISCLLIIFQIAILKKIPGGTATLHSKISFKDVKKAASDMLHNRKFLGFLGVSLFFHIAWQADWTLYYIGQVNYLKLDEAWLSYVIVGGAAVQFLTIGYWSRVNEKRGVRFSIILGSLGLSFFPLIMILGTSLPLSIGPTVFLTLGTLSNFAFATVSLNLLQCLLQVVPENNKTLSISLYTLLLCISNASMPMVGVKIYTAFGANLKALHFTFLILFAARIIATGLWTFRWWLLRHDPK